MRIDVTQAHIDEANKLRANQQPRDWEQYCRECPVALAAADAFKQKVKVTSSYIWLTDAIMTLPEYVRTFINKWDRQKPVQPISFTVYHDSL